MNAHALSAVAVSTAAPLSWSCFDAVPGGLEIGVIHRTDSGSLQRTLAVVDLETFEVSLVRGPEIDALTTRELSDDVARYCLSGAGVRFRDVVLAEGAS